MGQSGRRIIGCIISKTGQIYVEGWLTTCEHEAKDASGKRYRTEIVARQIRFLDGLPDASAAAEQGRSFRTFGHWTLARVRCTCMHGWAVVEFEWDANKAANNFSKHGVRFAEAVTVFEDDAMLTMPDDIPEEERFAAIGMGSLGRILVVIYTTRGDRVRIISARKATRQERSQYGRRRR